MGKPQDSKKNTLCYLKNETLYDNVKYSSLGSITAAIVIALVFIEDANARVLIGWSSLVIVAYLWRLIDAHCYFKADNRRESSYWRRRYGVGVVACGVAWGLSVWIVTPLSQTNQVLMVLALIGVITSSIASLSYDRALLWTFQGIMMLALESRLLLAGDAFSLKLVVFSSFIFCYTMVVGRIVTANYTEQLMLELKEEQHLSLIQLTERVAKIGYWQWDMKADSVTLSDNLAAMWERESEELSIDAWKSIIHPDDKSKMESALDTDLQKMEQAAIEYRVNSLSQNQDNSFNQITRHFTDSYGEQYLVGTVQDISQLKSAEKRIYRLAFFDDLTGLSNRSNFVDNLKTQLALAARYETKLAVVYLDLDDFKTVNDLYGHHIGDQYLNRFSEHLQGVSRKSDIKARIGGDEFSIIINNVSDRRDVDRACERILDFTNNTLQLENHRIQPKLSVGISMYPEDGEDADTLLKSADLAMYSVKQSGKHGYHFFEQRMLIETAERVQLEASLRNAIDEQQFELWYQPKVNLEKMQVTGVEALIRWRHPEEGLIPPDVFISTAERVGMIDEIGNWVLATSCNQTKRWIAEGIDIQMAINISGGHFTSDGFCENVMGQLGKYELAPSQLEIEVTESMTRDPQQHLAICKQLRDAGIRVAIDDFGTGYSSLSVLDNLEVDTLKVDKSFIDDLPHDDASKLLVRSIIELATGLGYDVVAEGVETYEQLEYLISLDCPYVQGYYFSKPVVADEIPAVVRRVEGDMVKAA